MEYNFGLVARQILIVEKKRALRDVARAMGMEYATLYARLSGRASFRPEEINRLIAEVPDPRLVDALLHDTPFLGVERPPASEWGNGADATGAALETAREVLTALQEIQSAAAEGKLTAADRRDIEDHVRQAERALMRLRLALPHLTTTAMQSAPVPKHQPDGPNRALNPN